MNCDNFALDAKELNLGVNYFALESIDYNGDCVVHCGHIDAVVLGKKGEIDIELAKNICQQEVKRQIATFRNTASCVK